MIDYWGRGETTSVEPVHLQVERPLERGHLIRQRAVRRAQFKMADREQLRPFRGAVYLDPSQERVHSQMPLPPTHTVITRAVLPPRISTPSPWMNLNHI